MAAVDALSLPGAAPGYPPKRWAIGLAFAIALHAAAALLLREAPDSDGPTELPAIEMDLSPPPGAVAPELPPSDASTETPPAEAEQKPDETQTVEPDAQRPAESETETADQPTPEQPKPLEDQTTAEAPPQEDALALPPEETVTAQEETPPPPQPKAAKKEPPPKREEKRREPPKPAVKTAKTQEKPEAQAAPSARAGGVGGVGSANAAASRAAAADYSSTVARILASQKRYPAAAQALKLSGRGVISFTLSRSGSVVRQSFSSTGSPILDQAMRDMLSRASFPPMPAEVPGATKSFTVPVGFSFKG